MTDENVATTDDAAKPGSGIQYTPMQVWLHPRQASSVLNSVNERLTEYTGMEKRMALTEEEAERLRQENRNLTDRLAASETAREQLEGKLAQLLDDEAYHREMDARIAEIESEFDKMVFMKQRYENTIATLKERLNDAHEELRRLNGRTSGVIDFDSDPTPISSPASGSSTQNDEPEPRVTASDSSRPAGATPGPGEKRHHPSPSRSSRKSNSDLEWLQSLPDKV